MRLFVLLSRVPYPLEKGDKLRAFNQIKYLSADNEIHLCALNSGRLHKDALTKLQQYCKSVNIIDISSAEISANLIRGVFSDKPFQVEYFYTEKAKKEIDELIESIKPEHIFCQLIRVSEYVKHYNISKTLDYQDAFSKNIERRMNASPIYLRWLLKAEFRRLLKYENEIYSYFSNRLIISAADREQLQHPEKDDIHIIPNGVDTEYFNPEYKSSDLRIFESSNHKYDLVFTGNMGYYPNIVSAVYLVNYILPEVKKVYPSIKLLIAGANPNRKVKELSSENVTVSGWVEDIRDSYAASKVFIAPMQAGTGLQNKLLEAMAMKLPCITSALANEALGAKNGEQILVCSSPKDYAEKIKILLEDKNKYEQIALSGFNFVKAQFNWKNIVKKLQEILNS